MGPRVQKAFLTYLSTALLLAGVLSCPFPAFGAFPLISTKTVAGSGGGADSAYALARDASGNLFVAGSLTQASGGLDIWLAKYDASLVLQSTYTYDATGFADEAWGVALDTASGNVFAAGYVSSGPTTSSRDIWLGKFDANLVLLATTTFNGNAGDDDAVMGLRLDGGSLYAVGRSSHNQSAGQWVARYDLNLVLLSSSILAQVTPVTLDLLPLTGGVVFAAGSRAPNPATSNDAWVGKYDANLVLITSATLDGPTANSDEYRRLLDDGAGGVYAVGYLYTGTLADRFIAHYDSNLVLISSSLANGAGNADEYLTDVRWADNGNFLVAGDISEAAGQGGRNAFVAEYTPGLALVSSASYRSGAAGEDHAYSVLLAGGELIAVGWADVAGGQDAWLARISTAAAAAPAAPTGFAGTAQSTASLLWSWTDASNNEDGFRVLSGTISISGNLSVDATAWLQSGLTANTSYGAYSVEAFNSSGTSASGTASRYTLASAPSGLFAPAVWSSSATLSWSGSATSFGVERSTGGAFASIGTSTIAVYSDTGLFGATTYYYRVRGFSGDALATAYTSSVAVVTIPAVSSPAAPSGFAGAAQSTSSILWSWTDASNNEDGFRVMSGTISISGDLAAGATSWLQAGLGADIAYGPYAAQAYNSSATANSGTATRSTLASAPTALAQATVGSSSATLSWSGTATSFAVERSTGAVFVQVGTSASAGYADLGLSAASTYYYRVRAFNGDALATAYASSLTVVTSPLEVAPSAPTGFTGTAVSTSSILWSWTDASSNEDGFRVVSGTISISTNLAQGATNWLQTGLAVNTAYGPYAAQAYNSSATANSSAVSRYTFAAAPGTPAFTTVYQSSVTVSWSANGNPGVTVYVLERSTGTGYGSHFTGSATYYFDQFLVPAATHTYRVRALNGDSLSSAYSATATAVALPPPALPGSAGTPVGVALGVSSISWTWVLASGATYHQLFRPADNSLLGASVAGPFVLSALTPNTAYGLRVAGANLGGIGPLSPSATVYTLAASPTGATASSATATTLAVSWGLGGNPVATVAQLDRSTNAIAYSSLTAAAVTAHADSGLLACTTYYYRVRNLNGDGLVTPYSLFQGVTANLTPTPPSGLTASANAGGTVSLAWTASPSEGITGYRLYSDTGTGNVSYGAPLAVLASTASAYTTGVLSSSAAYIFVLRAVHRCGVEESTGAIAMSGAAAAPPVVRAIIKEPDSGKRVRGNRLTLLGELIQGSPSDCQQIDFQYKEAAASTWTSVAAANINHPNPDFVFPYFTHADATSLAPGFYDLRAVAYDRSGTADPAPPAVRVEVVTVNPDIDENDDNGRVRKDQTINNGVTSVVDTAGGDAAAPVVRVLIPAGAVTDSTATVTVVANPAISTAAPSGQSLVGSAIKIDLSNGQTALNANAVLTLTYPDSIVFPSLLQIYYLNEATGRWTRDFTSTVDTTSRTVTGLTPHFSTFALMLGNALAGDLSDVRVYPVPYKPNGGNPDEGRPFSSSDQNSGIIFANLAPATTIKIFTMTGRQVSVIENVSVAGTIRWDAKNQDGREVVSGVYFAVIVAPGNKPVVRKMVIVR